MAVRYTSTTNSGSLEFILSLRQIRDNVRDERVKRIKRESESSGSRLTYHSGQETRFSQAKRKK